MPLGQVKKQVFRLYGKMLAKETDPVFLTPLACPSAAPWYDLQSHPVSPKPAWITPTFHWEKHFLRYIKRKKSTLHG